MKSIIYEKFGRTLHRLFLFSAFAGAAAAQSWTLQTSGASASFRGIAAVSERVAWASGTGGTYLLTTDGGATWKAAQVPGAETLDFRDVHAIDGRTAWLMAAGPGDKSRIYRTTDGGAHWTLQFTNPDAEGFFDSIAFWDAKRGLVVGDSVNGRMVVMTTADGGDHWRRVETPPAQDKEGAFAASGTAVITAGAREAWFVTTRARVTARERTANRRSRDRAVQLLLHRRRLHHELGVQERLHLLLESSRPVGLVRVELALSLGHFGVAAREAFLESPPAGSQRLNTVAAGVLPERRLAVRDQLTPVALALLLKLGAPLRPARVDLLARLGVVVFIGPVRVLLHFNRLDNGFEQRRSGLAFGDSEGLDRAIQQPPRSSTPGSASTAVRETSTRRSAPAAPGRSRGRCDTPRESVPAAAGRDGRNGATRAPSRPPSLRTPALS